MKLELGKIFINDIQFAQKTEVIGSVLYVDKNEVEEIVLSDARIKSVDVDIARPGGSVIIAPVKEVIDPRVKIFGEGSIFPGISNIILHMKE